jgi:hypothetical protein
VAVPAARSYSRFRPPARPRRDCCLMNQWSSRRAALADCEAAAPAALATIAEACGDLLELFGSVSGGRSDQGRDDPVAAVLALAAAAVAGMKGYTAISRWVKDVPPAVLADLYLRAGANPGVPRRRRSAAGTFATNKASSLGPGAWHDRRSRGVLQQKIDLVVRPLLLGLDHDHWKLGLDKTDRDIPAVVFTRHPTEPRAEISLDVSRR